MSIFPNIIVPIRSLNYYSEYLFQFQESQDYNFVEYKIGVQLDPNQTDTFLFNYFLRNCKHFLLVL